MSRALVTPLWGLALVVPAVAVAATYWFRTMSPTRARSKFMEVESDAGRYKLFNRMQSNNCARVRFWIYLRGLQQNFDIHETSHSDQKSDEFRELNPEGKIPLLVKVPESSKVDPVVIPESAVILEYLEEQFPDASGSPLMPRDPETRAHARLGNTHTTRTCERPGPPPACLAHDGPPSRHQ